MLNINYFRKLFENYSNSFLSSLEEENTKQNIQLKITHSKNVEKNCSLIAESEKLSEESIFIADLCGLFHDIGRFEQYTKYNTFRDDISIYHGQLGVEVLEKIKILKDLPENIIKIILDSTYNHGLLKIPDNIDENIMLFSKITRDADKIDIYRIVAEYYHKSGPRNIALEYNLDDSPIISESIIKTFCNGELISKDKLNTLNDFKCMQLSWIFDLNFQYTKDTVLSKNYLDSILNSISDISGKDILKDKIEQTLK